MRKWIVRTLCHRLVFAPMARSADVSSAPLIPANLTASKRTLQLSPSATDPLESMLRRRYRFTLHSLDQAVMISNQPRPTKVSKELHDYYRRHENGRKLLEGVKIFPETKKAEAAGANGQNKVRTSVWLFAPCFVADFGQAIAAPAHGR